MGLDADDYESTEKGAGPGRPLLKLNAHIRFKAGIIRHSDG